MEEVIVKKYKSFDGLMFDDMHKCSEHETVMRDIKDVTATLEPIPDDMDFTNGHGYIQQFPVHFNFAKAQALRLAIKYTPDNEDKINGYIKEYTLNARSYSHEPGAFLELMRKLKYLGTKRQVIIFLCDRFCQTDTKYREWGQMYYALNPEEGKQICLNEKSPTL